MSALRLADLHPRFYAAVPGDPSRRRRVRTLDDADGIVFDCPDCALHERRRHRVGVWFAARQAVPPGEKVWRVEGSGVDNLTLSPSIHIVGGCGWHGWIRAGEVDWA